MNFGPITDAMNVLAAAVDNLDAVSDRNAKDATDLLAAQAKKDTSDQDLILAKATESAALDQFGALAAQFVVDGKASLA